METNLNSEIVRQTKRWEELDVLFSVASEYDPDDQRHISLRRSAAMILCSHFEGAMKTLSKSMIRDHLEEYTFGDLPMEMQKRYVQEVLHGDADYDEGISMRIAEKLRAGSFVPDAKDMGCLFDHHSHLNGEVLRKWAKLFGVRDLFQSLKGSKLEEVFGGSLDASKKIYQDLYRSCSRGSQAFPYKFGFIKNDNWKTNSGDSATAESLFVPFLENAFQRRHGVAHGVDLGVSCTLGELQEDAVKMQVLLLGYTALSGLEICNRE